MSRLPEAGWLTAEQVVRESLADLARGKVVSVPSLRYRVAVGLLRHAPRSLVRRGSTEVAQRRGRG